MLASQLFDVVVPVKPLDQAKSRLSGLPRGPLMRAFALDALLACATSPLVRTTYVVTDDTDLATAAGALGCQRIADHGGGHLNLALTAAVEGLPGGAGVAALLGDLPCLGVEDLTAALGVVASRAVVADVSGLGSTMLAVRDPGAFRPHFGAGSFAAHVAAGYDAVQLPVPTLRLDVDTAMDLDDAVSLGVGPHTAAVLLVQDRLGHDGRAHDGR